jgi:hypothetical protein
MFRVYILLLICKVYGNEEMIGNEVGDSSAEAERGTLKLLKIVVDRQDILSN